MTKMTQTCMAMAAMLSALVASSAAAQSEHRVNNLVDVFVGTGGHGHTFPGATVPFGAVAASPDCASVGWDAAGGYHYDEPTILGFSQTHLSGTGLGDLGDFLFMPCTGPLKVTPGSEEKPETGYRSRFSHDDEQGQPGYYQVRLLDYDINVELTATERVAFHKYTFPASNEARVLLDLEHLIYGNARSIRQAYLQVHDSTTLTGYRVVSGFWAPNRNLYFAAKFSKPFQSHEIIDGSTRGGPQVKHYQQRPELASEKMKASFDFETSEGEVIYLKVAISPVSMNNALENLEAEIPHWDFDRVRKRAEALWAEALGRIEARGPEDRLRTFYSGLYHNLVAPNLHMDVNGEYRGLDQHIHNAEGFTNYTVFSLWDTFRGTHPLYTLIQQDRTDDFVHSMLAHQQESPYGMLPTWSMHHNETWAMIAYHSVPVVIDAWFKGLTTASPERILQASMATANHPGFDPSIYPQHYSQKHYIEMGYLPNDVRVSGTSITLETAYDDWCIGALAARLGHQPEAAEFLRRGQNFTNVFDPETRFFRARLSNGEWREPFDDRALHRDDPQDRDYTEGNAWQWLWFVPQDVQGLIDLLGGREAFVDKLDTLFSLPEIEATTQVGDVSGWIGEYAHGNEPCHHVAYLYCYAGEPWKAQERIHEIAAKFYSPKPEGYIGNEDCGQMSAWYVFSAMGFYPVNPCGGIYIIGSPMLPEATLNLKNGRTFRITANNFASGNVYVQSVKLNGQAIDRVWLRHEEITGGGSLEFVMGAKPSAWGAGPQDIPYSEGKAR